MQRYCQHIASCLMKSKIFPYCKILEQFMTHLVTFFPPVQLFLRHYFSSDPLIYSPKQSRQTLNRKWYNKIHHTYCKRNLLYITPWAWCVWNILPKGQQWSRKLELSYYLEIWQALEFEKERHHNVSLKEICVTENIFRNEYHTKGKKQPFSKLNGLDSFKKMRVESYFDQTNNNPQELNKLYRKWR